MNKLSARKSSIFLALVSSGLWVIILVALVWLLSGCAGESALTKQVNAYCAQAGETSEQCIEYRMALAIQDAHASEERSRGMRYTADYLNKLNSRPYAY